jgi:hypothetical protein
MIKLSLEPLTIWGLVTAYLHFEIVDDRVFHNYLIAQIFNMPTILLLFTPIFH